MVIWIIGLSGTGKTTIGRHIYELWRAEEPNTVFVDGDEIRAIFKHDRGEKPYTIEGRKKNADRICEMCAWLDRQGINIVCCILSIFEESRKWNRTNFSRYFEVFISVPMEILMKRDIKNLYNPAFRGEINNVVGVDIPFVPPEEPDFIFENSDDRLDFESIAADILDIARNKDRE